MQLKKKKSESFLQFRDRVWKNYYQNWQKKPVYCLALKRKVHFTNEGWEHVVGIGKSRSHAEIYQRIKLFKYVRSIIKRSGTIQRVRIIDQQVYYAFHSVEDYKSWLYGVGKPKLIKLVVKQKKTGKPIFYSIMK